MVDNDQEREKFTNRMLLLARVNVVIWAISIIALIFVISNTSVAKGMFPILAGGIAVGVQLISMTERNRKLG